MAPQLSLQQLAQVMKTYEGRIASKKLEIDSLSRLRDITPFTFETLFGLESPTCGLGANAAADYLTAKINWALIDLQELELTVKMLRSQSSGIVPAGVIRQG